jgi:hypothetical protein
MMITNNFFLKHTMVKQPIAKHVLIIEHFRYFLCSLIQLSDFYAIQCANWRHTNVL